MGKEGGGALKPKQQTVSNEVNTKMQLSTQCRASGTINISKYANIFLSTNPTTFILSSLVSEFDKESKSFFFFFFFFFLGGGGEGGAGDQGPLFCSKLLLKFSGIII